MRMLGSLIVLAGCTATTLNEDASFDHWCGASLCEWTTDEGRISRVSTWHPGDYGVSLDAAGTQISQVVNVALDGCTRVNLLADVDPRARVVFEVDGGGDGQVDFNQQVVGEGYVRVAFLLTLVGGAPTRFIFRKEGEGRARLAALEVLREQRCVPSSLAGLNEACELDAQCIEGRCTKGVCTLCAAGSCAEGERCARDADCASGACAVNYLVSSDWGPPSVARCAACRSDADCREGRCFGGACSTCDDDACESGAACRSPDQVDLLSAMCAPPPATPLGRGALCLGDSECAEGLDCAAPSGMSPRCGGACRDSGDCPAASVCLGLEVDGVLCGDDACAGSLPALFPPDPARLSEGMRALTCFDGAALARLYGV